MNILEKLEELERRIIPGKWESIDVLSGLLSVVTDKGPEIIHNQIHDDFICLCRNNIKALKALHTYA